MPRDSLVGLIERIFSAGACPLVVCTYTDKKISAGIPKKPIAIPIWV
jgi:hypothetical protein